MNKQKLSLRRPVFKLTRGYKKAKGEASDMRDTYPHDFLMGVIHLSMQTRINETPSKTFFRDRLRKLVKEGIYKEPNRWRKVWAFELLGELQFEGDTLLYGLFGKITGKGMESTFDMQNHHYSREYIEKDIAEAYSYFIINPESQTIIFEEKASLRYKHFIRMFKHSYNDFYNTEDEIDIDLIKDESKLLDDLEKKKILYIEFELHPSNPNDEEDFRPTDTLLREAHARKAKIRIENQSEGLSLAKEGLARQGVALTSASYGKYRAQVEQDGRKKIISSEKDKVLIETIDIDKFSIENLRSILKRFQNYKKKELGDKSG